jgi:hypothetical protein
MRAFVSHASQDKPAVIALAQPVSGAARAGDVLAAWRGTDTHGDLSAAVDLLRF